MNSPHSDRKHAFDSRSTAVRFAFVALLWSVLEVPPAAAARPPASAAPPAAALFAAPDEIHWTLSGPTSVTFDWRGASDTLRYGLTPDYDRMVLGVAPTPMPVSSPGPFREARIDGLVEDTVYHYSIGGGPDHTFRTAPPRGSSGFHVYAEGDIGTVYKYPRVGVVQAQIANDLPRFVLALGDLTYANDHGQIAVDRHFNDMMVWSQDAAYMPAWGNHDWEPADTLDNYKGRFELPNPRTSPGSPTAGGEDWYWFDYGNARFIAYPEPWPGAWADWYSRADALMDSAEVDPAITFVVTFGHRPAYSSGHHLGSAGLRNYLDALGDSHPKYVLNLNGHSHNYERSHPQHGVVHVTAGGGGSHLEWETPECPWAGGCPAPSWSAFRAMHHGPVRLSFMPTSIVVAAICGPAGDERNLNDVTCEFGTVMDSTVITARPVGENHVANPSFEADTSGWKGYHGGTIACIAGGFEGDQALCVHGPPALTSDFGVNDSPNWIGLVSSPNTVYRFQAWVRAPDPAGEARLQVREYRQGVQVGATARTVPAPLTPAWQLLSMDFTTAADSSTLDFQILDEPVAGGERFEVDAVSIRVVNAATTAVEDRLHGALAIVTRFVPNPTRRAGTLRFELPEASPVRAEIVDLQGRRIRTLADGLLAGGAHALRFDGRDENGARLRPGVYFCRVRSHAGEGRTRFLVLD